MPWKYVIAAVAVLVIAALIGYSQMNNGEPVEVATVEQGWIAEYVDEQGKTRLPRSYDITMPFDARLEEIELVEGQAIQAGDLVAQVAPADLQYELDEAQAVVDRLDRAIAENNDATVETTSRQQAFEFVKSMEATVEAADERKKSGQARLDYAESYLGRLRQASIAVTPDELQRAQVDAVTAAVDYRQDVLVWEAMRSIEAATRLLPTLITQYIDRKQLAAAVLEKEKAEAVARLNQVKARKERGAMRSPVDGVVLEVRDTHTEQVAAAGELLAKIGKLEELEVAAEILSEEAVEIRPGDRAEIYGPAIGAGVGKGVAGTVKRVNPEGFTKVSSLGVEQQRVLVMIEFDKERLAGLLTTRGLRVGYRVRVRVFTKEKPSGVFVPRSAVFRGADGQWKAFAVRGGRAELVAVKTGLINDQQVEIVEGLTPKQQVIVAPASSLQDGQAVAPSR